MNYKFAIQEKSNTFYPLYSIKDLHTYNWHHFFTDNTIVAYNTRTEAEEFLNTIKTEDFDHRGWEPMETD